MMKKSELLIKILAVLFPACGIVIVVVVIQHALLIDFDLYYSAGQALLRGQTAYQFYPPLQLPFQYFPWFGWMFIPLALLPSHLAWITFAYLNIALLFISIIVLFRLSKVKIEQNDVFKQFFLFGISVLMSLLVFEVGQISIILLFFCVLTIKYIHDKKFILAGWLFPFALPKPHLLLLFTPVLFKLGGKKFTISSVISIGFFVTLATILNPLWLSQMENVIVSGQNRSDQLLWGFSTLPGALVMHHWRIMNFYFAIPSLLIAIYLTRKQANLPFLHQASFALTLSLFAAPYSFAYDLPLLIPALICLSEEWNIKSISILIIAGLLPLLDGYQGQTYLLTVLVVALIVRQQNNCPPLQLESPKLQ